MRIHLIARRSLLLFAVSVLVAFACTGAPQLSVTVGFDSQVLRNSYAPFRIDVGGLAAPIEGVLVVRQTAGLPGERRAELVHVVASGVIENGTMLATLPIAEPLNPFTIELQSHDGRTLAVLEKSLRLGIRQWAFPVTVGRSTGIPSAAVISAAELPLDWWAYDAAREVWLVDPPISEACLEALGEWVVSGGSLVILTGSGFPLLDSPTLRRLLPLASPQLSSQDGAFLLSGALRAGARATLARGARPLLVQMPIGAGSVSVVTTALQDLSSEELAAVREKIPQVQRQPTTERVSTALLRSTAVPRPSYAAAPIITAVTILCLIGFGLLLGRRRWALVALVAAVLVVTVLSGLYANAHRRFVREYSVKTNISVLSSFGINSAFASFYAVEALSTTMRHELGSFPVGGLVLGARGATLGAESEPGETRFVLQSGERRDLLFHSRPQADDLRFTLSGDVAEIENRTGRVLTHAYVASGGAILSLPPIDVGAQRAALQTGPLLGEARSTYLALRSILRPIEEWLPIERRGAWLITLEELPQVTDRDAPELEREVFITILEAEAS